ncbi:MAG: Flp family type IVb pilin [Candidatus Cybelea sp.]|jgi:Flp pilus assembly pilin Flp
MLVLQALWHDEAGAQLVEYALLVTLIAIVSYVALQSIGQTLSTMFNTAANTI